MAFKVVERFLMWAGAGWPVVDELVAQGQLVETEYQGRKFYVRKLPGR